MQVNTVIVVRQIGTNGIPFVHSNCFINRSNKIRGNITTTHIITRAIAPAMILKINLIRRPIIKSEAVLSAFKGYMPGTETAISAINELDNKYPDNKIIADANKKNTNA